MKNLCRHSNRPIVMKKGEQTAQKSQFPEECTFSYLTLMSTFPQPWTINRKILKFRCHNMNKCNKTSAFPILKQYHTKLSFNFTIYSNEKSLIIRINGTKHFLRCVQMIKKVETANFRNEWNVSDRLMFHNCMEFRNKWQCAWSS